MVRAPTLQNISKRTEDSITIWRESTRDQGGINSYTCLHKKTNIERRCIERKVFVLHPRFPPFIN